MIIRPATLRALRSRLHISQENLCRATEGPGKVKVSISTIKRIESAGSDYDANSRIARTLAEALRVQPEDLAKDPASDADRGKLLREAGYRTFKTVVDGETELAFQVVERLYGIPVRSQVLMAPLFSALLAEGSLAWRRAKLTEIEEVVAQLESLGRRHLSFARATLRVQDGAADEKASIAKRDLFGMELGQMTYELGYDPSCHNPFADYLKMFAEQTGATEIEIEEGEHHYRKTPEGLPEYRIAPGFIEDITGGDFWAEYALLHGFVRLRDIPEKLMGEEASSARIEWLGQQVPEDERKFSDDISLDLSASGYVETASKD